MHSYSKELGCGSHVRDSKKVLAYLEKKKKSQ